MDLLHTCAEESSVHGLPHLVAKERHWLERVIWAVIVVISIYCSYAVCLSTWTRYQENPTVLTLETDYRHWTYRPPAVTICPAFINDDRITEVIKKYWNIEEESDLYPFYKQFVTTVANTTYANMNAFSPFSGNKSFANVDMLEIARTVRNLETMPSKNFVPVITEMGMCFTSSNYSRFQNIGLPQNESDRHWPSSCFSYDLCKSNVILSAYGVVKIHLFVHTEDDVMVATDIIKNEMNQTELVEVTVLVDQIVASSGLKNLSPTRRKCLYDHESKLYFDIYTINLCKIDCRIRRAVSLCGCIPFFYNVPNLNKCDATGMVCLANKLDEWYFKSCKCMDLCLSTKFTQKSVKVTKFPQLNNQLSVEMFFPKKRVKRSVLFSLSDLIVSFGGAAALFAGCSFLSGVEFFYFFLEYVGSACWKRVFHKGTTKG